MGSLRTAVMLVPSAVAGSLSYWQVQRMRTKEAAVEQAREAMAAPPIDLTRAAAAAARSDPTASSLLASSPPPPLAEAATAAAHRRVAAEGRYLHSRSVFVGPRPLSVSPSEPAAQRRLRGVLSAPGSALKRGYLLVTPLELDGEEPEGEGGEEEGERRRRPGGDGGGWFGKRARAAAPPPSPPSPQRVVLVNRGWVPPEWRALWPLAFPDEGGGPEEELASGWSSSSSGSPADDDAAAAAAAAAALRDAQPLGRVRVTGVAQPDETPSSFVPQNAVRDRRDFFSVVASEIAAACGVWPPGGGGGGKGSASASPSSGSAASPALPPPPLVQVCYDDSPGGGGVLDPQGRGERPTTRALPAELEAAARAAGGAAVAVGDAARERERRIAAAASAAPEVSVFPLPKPASGLVRFSIMPEDHAGYAAMWGMMSAAMAVLAVRRRRPPARRR